METRPQKPLSVFAVIYGFPRPEDRAATVMLVKRARDKKFQLPGDELEPGEDEATALRRAVLEQVGLEVRIMRQIGPYHEREGAPNIVTCFECVVGGGAIRKAGPYDEFCDARYFTLAEIRKGSYVTSPRPGDSHTHRISLIGPRTERMVLDAFSVKAEPMISVAPFSQPELLEIEALGEEAFGKFVCSDGFLFLAESSQRILSWLRLGQKETVPANT